MIQKLLLTAISLICLSNSSSFGQQISNHIDLVDTSNGALKLSYEDFRIPGRGQGLDFTRSYNNQSQYNGPLGYNWHFNWNLTLSYRPSETRETVERVYENTEVVQEPVHETKSTPEKVTIIETNGFLREFNRQGDEFVSIHFEVEEVKRVDGGFVREFKDGTKQYFTRLIEKAAMPLPDNSQKVWIDENGKQHVKISLFSNSGEREVYKLSKVIDRYGNTTSFNYNQFNQLVQIIDSSGRGLTLDYTPRGKIKTVIDPIGRKFIYDYDYNDHLLGVTDPANRRVSFEYDNEHNLTKITCPQNAVLRITYDKNNRVINLNGPEDKETSYSYIATDQGKGLITTITDGLGNKTRHEYQSGYYEYQDKHLVITDPEGKVWEKYRNARKSITKQVTPNGDVRNAYDDKNNLIQTIDPEGGKWGYAYEPNFNRIKSVTNPNQQTTELTYDDKGSLIKTTQPDGGVVSIGYNSYGQPISMTDPNGHTTRLEYNTCGNLSAVRPIE